MATVGAHLLADLPMLIFQHGEHDPLIVFHLFFQLCKLLFMLTVGANLVTNRTPTITNTIAAATRIPRLEKACYCTSMQSY